MGTSTVEPAKSAADDQATPPPGRELKNYQPVSLVSVRGRGALLFGGAFILAGAFIVLVAADVIPVEPSSVHVPRWLVAVCGLIFGLPGVYIAAQGVGDFLRRARHRRLSLRHPHEPWLADHAWSPTGTIDRVGTSMPMQFAGMTYVGLFLLPLNYLVIAEDGPWYALAFAGIFDLAFVAGCGWVVYVAARRAKFGRSFLHYRSFPFFLGEMVDAVLDCPRGIGAFESIRFTLRCVEERYEIRGTGDNRSEQVICYERYADEVTIDEAGEHGADGQGIDVSFLLPADASPTNLAARPAIYWQLEVSAKTPGVDYKSMFLVPVYAKA